MRTLKNYENKPHGTPDFPCKLYRVDRDHSEYVMPFHWHSEYEIIFVRSGRLDLTADDRSLVLEKGDSVFLSDGALHGGIPSGDDCLYDCIVFSGEFILKNTSHKEIKSILRHEKSIKTFLPNNEFEGVGRRISALCECLANAESDGDTVIATGILLEIFGEIIKSGGVTECGTVSNKHISRLKNVISYIDSHYSEKVTLEGIAQAVGVSPKYLCRTFVSLTGKTPISYLNEYRVECACEMLRGGEESMLDIAAACGFGDQSYFVKQFRKTVGVTPGAYRKGKIKKEL